MAGAVGPPIRFDLIATSHGVKKGTDAARNELSRFDRRAATMSMTVTGSFTNVTSSALRMATGIGAAATAFASLRQATNVVTDSVRLAAEAEKTAGAFETFTGDAAKADALLGRIRKFAADSPFKFAESSNIAKQLLAADVAVDQIVPTLRTLGDLAVGDAEKLGRLAYAYGQVKSARQLYGTELRQFTETGIPLIPELAKVLKIPVDGVKKAVEDGKVQITHLQHAMKDLTSEGGRFYGMTDRYARSFGGMMEQLQDAVQVAKTELGRAIIEEMGLKDAARDLTAYTGRIKGFVAELRPAIRFAGDLAWGVAQVGNEFGKAGIQLAGMGIESFARAVPEVRELSASFGRLVEDAKNFRFDPVEVAKFGFIWTRGIIIGFGFVRRKILELGIDTRKEFVDPFLDAARSIKTIAEEILGVAQQVRALQGKPPLITNPSDLPGIRQENLRLMDARQRAMNEAGLRARGEALKQVPRSIHLVEEMERRARALEIAKFTAEDRAAGRKVMFPFDERFPPSILPDRVREGDARASVLDSAAALLGSAAAHAPFLKTTKLDPLDDLESWVREAIEPEIDRLKRSELLRDRQNADLRSRELNRANSSAPALIGGLYDAVREVNQLNAGGGIFGGPFGALRDAAKGKDVFTIDASAIAAKIETIAIENRLAGVVEVNTQEWTRAQMQALMPRRDDPTIKALDTIAANTNPKALLALLGGIAEALGNPVNLDP